MILKLSFPLILIVVLMPAVSFSQSKQCKYPEVIPYCIFPKPFRLSKVAGHVHDKDGAGIRDSCATLFTNKSHKKVISGTVNNDDGRFTLRNVSDGTYILVVRYISFTPALATIILDHKRGSSRLLRIKMVLGGIDTCSEVALEK